MCRRNKEIVCIVDVEEIDPGRFVGAVPYHRVIASLNIARSNFTPEHIMHPKVARHPRKISAPCDVELFAYWIRPDTHRIAYTSHRDIVYPKTCITRDVRPACKYCCNTRIEIGA